MSYRMITCDVCGRKHRDYNSIKLNIDGEEIYFCISCQHKYLRRCFECGEWLLNENIDIRNEKTINNNTIEAKGRYGNNVTICQKCSDNYYYECDHCGDIVHTDFTTYIDNEVITVCNSCRNEHYWKCEECGKWFSNDDDSYPTRTGQICEYCCDYGEYNYCNDCGYYATEGEWNDEDETFTCERCIEKQNNNCIHNYHDSSVIFEKHRTTEDIKNNNSIFYGFELEVSGDRRKAKKFLNILNNEVCLMNDSSIKDGGFEIVSMPMTKNYIKENFIPKFSEALTFLKNNNFKGHNYGGLHIHVSEDALSKQQLAHLKTVLYGNELDRNTWLQITQRKKNEMSQWSKMCHTDFENLKSFHEIYNDKDNYKKPIVSSRYTALNYSGRTHTYEFRIFNSNLRIERFLKNFECIWALMAYTKENSDKGYPCCTTRRFVEYVLKNGIFYPHLYSFINERGIKENFGKEIEEIQNIA